MSRMNARRSTAPLERTSGRDLAQIADQQQVLEVGGDGRQVLERFDRLLAAVGVTRAQRRSENALKQRGLAVGRAAKNPQVAPADPVPGELGHGPHDLPLGLLEVPHARTLLALDHPELDELTYQ